MLIRRHDRFTGHVGPVAFKDGEAVTDNAEVIEFAEANPDKFEVGPGEPEPEPEADPYDLTNDKLRALCKERGLSDGGNKADLQDRLRAADKAGEPE